MSKKRLVAIGIRRKGEKGFIVKAEKPEKPKIKKYINFMGEMHELKY